MKRILAIAAAAIVSLQVMAQNTRIEARVEGLPDGTSLEVVIGGTFKKKAEVVATAPLQGGKALFTFDSQEPRLYNIKVAGVPYGNCSLAMQPGESAVVATKARQAPGRNDYCEFSATQVSGSPTNDLWLTVQVDREALNKMHAEYNQRHAAVSQRMGQARQAKDQAAIAEIMKSEAWQALENDEHAFFEEVKRRFDEALDKAKDTWMGPLIPLTNYSYITEENAREYNLLSQEAKDSYYGKVLKNEIWPQATQGKVADFTFTDANTGKTMTMYEVLKDCKYCILDFWASWCNPCRKEIPNFKAQYELYKDKGLQIVSISADKKEADWRKALAEENTPWPNDIDGDKGIADMYGVKFYPTVHLIASDGTVICSNNDARGEALQAKLKELFAEQ